MSPMLLTLLFINRGRTSETFQVDGVERTALVYRPSKRSAHPPMVLIFHGFTATSRLAAAQFDFQDLWPEALVLYPQGLPTKLFPGRAIGEKNGWQIMPGQSDDRDIKFLDAMRAWGLKQGADPARCYVCGHSNGAGFTWVAYIERGADYAAFAALNGGTLLPIEKAPARPGFLATGTNDRLVPPQTVINFAERLARHNRCGPALKSGSVTTFPGQNRVVLSEYEGGHLPPKDVFREVVQFLKGD